MAKLLLEGTYLIFPWKMPSNKDNWGKQHQWNWYESSTTKVGIDNVLNTINPVELFLTLHFDLNIITPFHVL